MNSFFHRNPRVRDLGFHATMTSHLAEEIIAEILSRLPVKTLIRFRCVSKSWSSLISGPDFVSLHLMRSNKNKKMIIFRYFTEQDHFFLYPDENFPSCQREKLDCPLKGNCHVNIVGSCNGVVCLAVDTLAYTHRAVLWNPSVRKTVTIPVPDVSSLSHGPFMHSLGFGFDSVSNDYKVVRIVHLFGGFGANDENPLVEVYSLKSGCWRMAGCSMQFIIMERSQSVFLNGACHWVADSLKKERSHRSSFIVTFSLGDEVFSEIAGPECLVCENSGNSRVAILNGCLSLVPSNRGFGESFCEVWMMKEYGNAGSWNKLYNVQNLLSSLRFVALRNDGQLLLTGRDGLLMFYDPENGLHEAGMAKAEARSFYLDTYEDSLVLLNESDEVLEEDPSSDNVFIAASDDDGNEDDDA